MTGTEHKGSLTPAAEQMEPVGEQRIVIPDAAAGVDASNNKVCKIVKYALYFLMMTMVCVASLSSIVNSTVSVATEGSNMLARAEIFPPEESPRTRLSRKLGRRSPPPPAKPEHEDDEQDDAEVDPIESVLEKLVQYLNGTSSLNGTIFEPVLEKLDAFFATWAGEEDEEGEEGEDYREKAAHAVVERLINSDKAAKRDAVYLQGMQTICGAAQTTINGTNFSVGDFIGDKLMPNEDMLTEGWGVVLASWASGVLPDTIWSLFAVSLICSCGSCCRCQGKKGKKGKKGKNGYHHYHRRPHNFECDISQGSWAESCFNIVLFPSN